MGRGSFKKCSSPTAGQESVFVDQNLDVANGRTFSREFSVSDARNELAQSIQGKLCCHPADEARKLKLLPPRLLIKRSADHRGLIEYKTPYPKLNLHHTTFSDITGPSFVMAATFSCII